jgi:FkbM family methyltransferase
MNVVYILVAGILSAWLASLSWFTFKKSRGLFARQSKLGREYAQFRDGDFNCLRIEVEKQKRLNDLLQANKNSSSSMTYRFTSQFSEDLVLYEFFREHPPGFFVEAGAYDGVTFSNTYLLETLGWKGLLVEPHPGLAETCRQQRPDCEVVQKALGPNDANGTIDFTCADDANGGSPLSFTEASQEHIERCGKEGYSFQKIQVELASLDSLLERRTQRVDFLSLDIEGFELQALKGFDLLKFSPSVLLVELNFDSRDEAVKEHVGRFGYLAVGDVGCNRFFCREQYADQLKTALQIVSPRASS